MNTKLQRLIEPKAGLNFLVPSQWMHQFLLLNQQSTGEISSVNDIQFNQLQLQKLVIPYYNPTPYVQTKFYSQRHFSFGVQIADHPVDQPQMQFHQFSYIRSKPLNQPILQLDSRFPPFLEYDKIQTLNLSNQNLTHLHLSKLDQCNPELPLNSINLPNPNSFLLQKTRYLPKQSSLISVVQEIGNYLGFFENYNTKLSFPAKNSDQSFSFYQTKLKNMSLQSASDNLILVFNMEKHQTKRDQSKQNRVSTPMEIANQFWQNGQALPKQTQTAGYRNISQNVNGTNYSNSNIAIVNDGTQSTGADSFFSFQQAYFNPISNQNGQNFAEGSQTPRIPQLLKNLQQQDVHAMKNKASQAIYGDLLQIPDISQQKIQEQLQILAEQIISFGDFRKKKSPMPMSLQKSEKGWNTLQNSNFEMISGYGQPLIDQSEDTEN